MENTERKIIPDDFREDGTMAADKISFDYHIRKWNGMNRLEIYIDLFYIVDGKRIDISSNRLNARDIDDAHDLLNELCHK